jgi:hypothetical protein
VTERDGSPGPLRSATTHRREMPSSRWSTSSSRFAAGGALELAIGPEDRASSRSARGPRRGHRPLAGHGRPAAARSRAGDEIPSRSATYSTYARRGHVLARVHRFNSINNNTTQEGPGRDVSRNAAATSSRAGASCRGRRAATRAAVASSTWRHTRGRRRVRTPTRSGSSRTISARRRQLAADSMPFRAVSPAELDLMAQLAACTYASAGATGITAHSRARARSTSRLGRRRERRPRASARPDGLRRARSLASASGRRGSKAIHG